MSAMFVVLNQESPVPPYEQIRSQVQMLIASAQLAPGVLLPSVRQLARDLGIAPNTVARAYSELESAGWVTTEARRGVVVAASPPLMTTEERQQRLQLAVSQLLVTTRQLGVSPQELHAELERQLGSLSPKV